MKNANYVFGSRNGSGKPYYKQSSLILCIDGGKEFAEGRSACWLI